MFKRLGAIAVPAFIIVMAILYVSPSEAVFDPPLLLFILNTLFISIVAFVGSYISARSYLMSGSPGLLLMGCGMLAIGIGALIAGLLRDLPDGANLNVTMFNIGVLLSSAFHFTAATLISAGMTSKLLKTPGKPKVILVYAPVLVFLTFVMVASLQGAVPRFFIQGVGGTPLRQVVLGAAVALFLISSCLFMRLYSEKKADFLYWYSLSLTLFAVGLFAVFLQRGVGEPLGWTGRTAQYLGGIFLLISVLTSRAR